MNLVSMPCQRAFWAAILSAPLLAQASALDWELDSLPPDRNNPTFVYDSWRGEAVLFGGLGARMLGDTWLWKDGWRRLESPSSPSPRANAAAAFDSVRGRVVLVGGRTSNGVLNDTWVYDGSDWSMLSVAQSPPGLYAASMAYDVARDRMVLLGGRLGLNGPVHGDLWEFDGLHWSMVPQAGLAGCDHVVGLVYDEARAELLRVCDTSLAAWDGSAWSPRDGSGLGSTLGGSVLYDPVGQRVLLLNPGPLNGPSRTTFAYQGAGWTPLATIASWPTAPLQMVAEPTTGAVLAWQASDASNIDPESHTWRSDLWQWQKVVPGSPLGREDAAMVYDSSRRQLVLQGGSRAWTSTRFETWELGGRTWRLATRGQASFVAQRRLHGMAYDESRQTTVMFGGASSGQRAIAEWIGGHWMLRQPTSGPGDRVLPAMTYDAVRQRIVVFGGLAIAGYRADLWSWDGTNWTELTPPAGPSPRNGAGLSFDRARDRVVLFGGTDGVTHFDDTWEFDGLTWALQNPTSRPSGRSRHVQAYAPDRQATLIFGGDDGAGRLDTWSWDGQSWQPIVTSRVPDTGLWVAGAYDNDRRELVVHGGWPGRGETWRLRMPGQGSWSSRGVACDVGYGSIGLDAESGLFVDRSTGFTVGSLPSHFASLATLWIGFGDQQWNGQPLPVTLGAFGAPGCSVYLDPTVPFYLPNTGSGTTRLELHIPNAPALLDTAVFAQAVAWDLLTNRFGTSNLIAARVGSY